MQLSLFCLNRVVSLLPVSVLPFTHYNKVEAFLFLAEICLSHSKVAREGGGGGEGRVTLGGGGLA